MLFINHIKAQDPLWTINDESFNFDSSIANPFDNPTSLPMPSILAGESQNPDFYFHGGTSIMHQNAQYDDEGNLLFFVHDGFIYNKDGYLIEMPQFSYEVVDSNQGYSVDRITNDCNTCIWDINSPDVLITAVPGSCRLFYVIFHGKHINSNDNEFYSSGYAIVDIIGDNEYFDDPSIKGRTINNLNEDEAGFQMYASYQGEGSTIVLSETLHNNNEKPFFFMEILEFPNNTNKKLYIANNLTLYQYDINDFGIQLETTRDLSTCFTGENIPTSTENDNDILDIGPMAGGDMQITYSQDFDTYLLAMTFFYNSGIGLSGTAVALWEADLSGNLLPEASNCALFSWPTYGMHFSEDGRYLYLSHLAGANEVGQLSCNFLFGQSGNILVSGIPLDPDLVDLFETRDLKSSRMEDNYINGEKVIMLWSDTSLGYLKNTNDPGNLEYVSIPNTAYIDQPKFKTYLDYTLFSASDLFNTEYRFKTLPKQNVNGTQIQDYLAQDLCCSDLLAITGVNDIVITGNHTWTPTDNPFDNSGTSIKVNGTITIADDANITMDGMTFEFGENARLVIQAGGKVKMINNAVLTSVCDTMWPGVIIYGNYSVDQIPQTNGDQGYLFMSNSTIENALVGAEVKGGAIIRAFDSTIRNNEIGVQLNPYSFGGLQNRSRFFKTNFVTDQALLNDGLEPKYLLELNDVVGISIRDCNFYNAADGVYNINHRGYGLHASNSSFTINDNPNVNGENYFAELTVGVHTEYKNNRTFAINDMTFDQNRTGIIAINNFGGKIVNNYFGVPDYFYLAEDDNRRPEGIYMLNSTKYTIEENDLDHIGVERKGTYGLIVDNSGSAENLVFRNWFDNFQVGVYIKNINRDPVSEQNGLQVRCEFFTNNQYDFYLDDYSEWRDTQGDPIYENDENDVGQRLTNNRFSIANPICDNNYRDMYIRNLYGNNTANDIAFTYWHLNDPITEPDCGVPDVGFPNHIVTGVPGPFSDVPFIFETVCETDFDLDGSGSGSGGGHIIDPRSNTQLLADHLSEMNNLQDAQYLYSLTVNQGDGINLIDAITKLNPMASSELRNLLLQRFPLSKEVLKKTIRRLTPMDPWHLTQVMLANAPLEKDVMYALEDTGVLSDFFMNFIFNANNNSGANIRQLLELEINHRSLEKARMEKILIDRYLYPIQPEDETAESIPADYASYYSLLQTIDEDWAHEVLARKAMDDGDVAKCNTEVAAMKDEDRQLWWAFRVTLGEDASNLTSAQIDALWNIYLDEGISYGEALQWLHAADETDVYPLVLEPQNRSLSFDKPRDRKEFEIKDILLTVSPSPAHDIIHITYPPEADGLGSIEIIDAKGALMTRIDVKQHGLLEVDVRDWKEGLYLLRLQVDGLKMASGKFTIVRD